MTRRAIQTGRSAMLTVSKQHGVAAAPCHQRTPLPDAGVLRGHGCTPTVRLRHLPGTSRERRPADGDAYAVQSARRSQLRRMGRGVHAEFPFPRTWENQFQPTACPLLFVEILLPNALATGNPAAWRLRLDKADANLTLATLRATLVWTDPPGNPAAFHQARQ